MKEFLGKPAVRVLLCLILLTVAFIFTQSALPPSASSDESDAVGSFLARLFPPDTAFGGFLSHHLRKIAHFCEHGTLGAETCAVLWLFLFFRRPKGPAILSCAARQVGFGALVAFLDETVQIFSGRGPAIQDVWIDLAGYVTFTAVLSLVVFLVLFLRKKKN